MISFDEFCDRVNAIGSFTFSSHDNYFVALGAKRDPVKKMHSTLGDSAIYRIDDRSWCYYSAWFGKHGLGETLTIAKARAMG